MILQGIEKCTWRFVAMVALALSVLPGVAFGDRVLSDEAFEQLKINVQAELDARHKAALSTDEVFPGATASFILPDGRIARFATGFSDVEEKVEMTPEARMPSGSIGKMYVAAVALSMALDGTLDLDGKISQWLGTEPWFERLQNGDAITLRHLLNHSSGLIDHVFAPDSGFGEYAKKVLSPDKADSAFDPRDLVQFVLDREPLFPAGKGFSYTDTGYILVGLIIEKASGSTYYEELDRVLLKPLKLARTTAQNRRDIAGLAQGYAHVGHQLFGLPVKVVENGTLVFDPSLEWTGGGVVNNPQELVRWAKVLYEGKAMEKPYLDALLNSVAKPDQGHDGSGRTYGYSLGVSISKTELGTSYGHGGFFPGYNSFLAYYPDREIAVAMQINTDSSELEEHFAAIAKIIISAVTDK